MEIVLPDRPKNLDKSGLIRGVNEFFMNHLAFLKSFNFFRINFAKITHGEALLFVLFHCSNAENMGQIALLVQNSRNEFFVFSFDLFEFLETFVFHVVYFVLNIYLRIKDGI